jgi:hypothetical protein
MTPLPLKATLFLPSLSNTVTMDEIAFFADNYHDLERAG